MTRRGARLGAAVLLCGALVSCTTRDSPARSEPGRPTASPPGATAPRGGVVRIGVVGSPATLDPYSAVASDLTYALARPMYPALYETMPDGSTRASLARRLEHVSGGVRIFLRRTRWSDGTAVTARDVVASIRRATSPSGFARINRVEQVTRHSLVVGGYIGNWRRALATLSFVVPDWAPGRGHRRGVGGGAWRMASYTPGLKATYKPNRRGSLTARPLLDKVVVLFVESENVLLQLLRDGSLDAAVPPSTVNLSRRLDEMELEHAETLGWESVRLVLEPSIPYDVRAAVAATVDRDALVAGLVRDDGRLANTLHPSPESADGRWAGRLGKRRRVDTPVTLAAPAGDELAGLIQRAMQIQLTESRVAVEPLTTSAAEFYGSWRVDDPADVAIVRAAGAPGLRDGRSARRRLTALPIAQVRTYLAWRPRLHGLEVNPTYAGPLWNAERWWLARP